MTLKIKVNNYPDEESAERELSIIQKITNKNSKHMGYPYVQHLLDSFTLEGPHGNHVCLILKPLKEPLWILKSHFADEVFTFDVFRLFVEVMLHSLDYLHRVPDNPYGLEARQYHLPIWGHFCVGETRSRRIAESSTAEDSLR